MKYVVLSAKRGGLMCEIPFIFHNLLVHVTMAAAMSTALRKHGFTDVKPLSAGEFCLLDGSCSGKSDTLNLESRGEEDAHLIALIDYGFGIS
jgi:hypothetical protein